MTPTELEFFRLKLRAELLKNLLAVVVATLGRSSPEMMASVQATVATLRKDAAQTTLPMLDAAQSDFAASEYQEAAEWLADEVDDALNRKPVLGG